MSIDNDLARRVICGEGTSGDIACLDTAIVSHDYARAMRNSFDIGDHSRPNVIRLGVGDSEIEATVIYEDDVFHSEGVGSPDFAAFLDALRPVLDAKRDEDEDEDYDTLARRVWGGDEDANLIALDLYIMRKTDNDLDLPTPASDPKMIRVGDGPDSARFAVALGAQGEFVCEALKVSETTLDAFLAAVVSAAKTARPQGALADRLAAYLHETGLTDEQEVTTVMRRIFGRE